MESDKEDLNNLEPAEFSFLILFEFSFIVFEYTRFPTKLPFFFVYHIKYAIGEINTSEKHLSLQSYPKVNSASDCFNRRIKKHFPRYEHQEYE